MKNTDRFINFLESLKGNGHDTLIESVKTGFQACHENENTNDVVKQRAFAFNGLMKEGVILEILKTHVSNFGDSFKEIDQLIDNAMDEIQEEISNKGAYDVDDMTNPELEKLENFIKMRINKTYGNALVESVGNDRTKEAILNWFNGEDNPTTNPFPLGRLLAGDTKKTSGIFKPRGGSKMYYHIQEYKWDDNTKQLNKLETPIITLEPTH